MKLTKKIPARKKTVKFNWCQRNWMKMSPAYREIRNRCKNKMISCFWCGHNFEDGENFAIAQPVTGGNKALCHDCADVLLSDKTCLA